MLHKSKNWEHAQSLEVVEVILVQSNLEGNQYHVNYEVLYTFTANKTYAYLLNVKLSKWVFLTTCNTEFDNITKTSTGQSNRPLKKRQD